VDDLHRLQSQWAEAQDAYQRQASENIAATLQYESRELKGLGFIIRDRPWALTLGHEVEIDDAQVQYFFGTLISRVKAPHVAVADHLDELDEAAIAVLAALGLVGSPLCVYQRQDLSLPLHLL